MLGKTEYKINKPRDGRHCDLCGCSFPAVRCDKCNSQIFCLSCDDMYHRHPKRRFHLRKAVDPTPTPQARPVLPMKVANLPLAPGDPSKMPLPPPRKKKPGKSFFDTFRRGSPSSDNSPPLPKKEYSWTDRLGSIKKFMSNRPLPPVPDNVMEDMPTTPTTKNDLSFIHKRVDEKPPQLPQRQPKPQTQQTFHDHTNNEGVVNASRSTPNGDHISPLTQVQHGNGEISKVPSSMLNGSMNRFVHSRGHSLNENNPWPMNTSPNMNPQAFQHNMMDPNVSFGNSADMPGFSTLRRQTHSPTMASNESQSGMHQSASATDLHLLTNAVPFHGMPQYPPYPMNPQAAQHYPYPMYPPYPNYPQYFGNSWANLSSQPTTTDGDFSDQSEASSGRFLVKRPPLHKDRKAKRSQSVMFDRMAYPGQFYPYGPYPPGYGPQPWMPTHPVETPPSPASSIRSLNRVGRTHRRRKTIDDDNVSASSSPLSRAKSSSSERPDVADRRSSSRRRKSNKSSSSEEDYAGDETEDGACDKHKERLSSDRNHIKEHNYKRRGSSPQQASPSHKMLLDQKKHFGNFKKQRSELSASSKPLRKDQSLEDSDSDMPDKHDTTQNIDHHSSSEEGTVSPWIPLEKWQCQFCTFINSAGERICQVCCKTAVKSTSPVHHSSIENIVRKGSLSSRKSTESPCIRPESESKESVQSGTDKQDMALLNSALDAAEKEINRGLEELLKINDEPSEQQPTIDTADSTQNVASNLSSDTNFQLKPVTAAPSEIQSLVGKNENGVADKPLKPINSLVSMETQTSSDNIENASNLRTARTGSVSSVLSDSTTSHNQDNGIVYKLSEKASSPLFSRVGKQRALPIALKQNDTESQQRKDSSCQTQQDTILEFLKRKKAEEIALSNVTNQRNMNGGYQYPYGRLNEVMSPSPQNFFPPNDRGLVGGYGMMHRSHSRASLFGGRLSDAAPATHEYGGFGYGPSSMYRSLSRTSLTCDSTDGWISEFQGLRKPDYYLSMEELVERRRQETMKAQGLELVRMIREAEQQGFTADDIQVALNNCGKQNPVVWLQDNWKGLINTVVTLSTNYGNDKKENDIGVVCENEARDALRLHKGNIWAAVTECVEGRQRKFLELSARGNFTCKEIIEALTSSEGNVEMAYAKLTKTSLKPFLMRIWGTGEGAQNQEGALPRSPSPTDCQDEPILNSDKKDDLENNTRYEEFSEQETWEDDEYEEEEVAWEEDPDEEIEEADLNDMTNVLAQKTAEIFVASSTNSLKRNIHKIQTPESDKSDYCDAFDPGLDDHNLSSSIDEIYLVGLDDGYDFDSARKPETKKKGTSFLSKLAALRKEGKPTEVKKEENIEISTSHSDDLSESSVSQKPDAFTVDNSKSSELSPDKSEQTKNFSPFGILKHTLSAIKDTVTGVSTKNDKNNLRSISERRTIIVHGRVAREALPVDSIDEVASLISYKSLSPEDDAESSPNLENSNVIVNTENQKHKPSSCEGDVEILPIVDEKDLKSNAQIQIIQTLSASEVDAKIKQSDVMFANEQKIKNSKHTKETLPSNEKNVAVIDTVDETNSIDKSSSSNLCSLNYEIGKHSPASEIIRDVNEKNHSSFDKIDSLPIHITNKLDNENYEIIRPGSTINIPHGNEIPKDANDLNSNTSSSKENFAVGNAAAQLDAYSSSANGKEIISDIHVENRNSGDKNASLNNQDIGDVEKEKLELQPRTTQDLKLIVSRDEDKYKKKVIEKSSVTQQQTISIGGHHKESMTGSEAKSLSKVNVKTTLLEQSVVLDTIKIEHDKNIIKKETFVDHTSQNSSSNENVKSLIRRSNEDDGATLDNFVKESNSPLPIPSQVSTIVQQNSDIFPKKDQTENAEDNSSVRIKPTEIVKNDNTVNLKCTSATALGNSIEKLPSKNIKTEKKNKIEKTKFVPNRSNEKSEFSDAVKVGQDKLFANFTTNCDTNVLQDDRNNLLQLVKSDVNTSKLSDGVNENDLDVPHSSLKKESNGNVTNLNNPIIIDGKETPINENDTNFTPNASTSKDNSLSVDYQTNVESNVNASKLSNNVKQDDLNVPLGLSKNKSQRNIPNLNSPHIINNETEAHIKIAQNDTNPTPIVSTSKDDSLSFSYETKDEVSNNNENLKLSSEFSKYVSKTEESENAVTENITMSSESVVLEKKSQSNENILSRTASLNLNDSESPEIIVKNDYQANLHNPFSSDPIQQNDLKKAQSDLNHDTNISESDSLSPSVLANSSTILSQTNHYEATTSTEDSTNIPYSSEVLESKEIQTINSLSNTETEENNSNVVDQKETALAEKLSSSPLSAIRHQMSSVVMEENIRPLSPARSQSPFGRMTLNARREAIAQERNKDSGNKTPESKPWFLQKTVPPIKQAMPKKSLKQQLEFERKVRKLVSDRKCRTYRKAEIVVQLLDMKFGEDEAIQAASECANLEQAISYLQQECLLCTGQYPIGEIISMVHCSHKACKECIKAYFTIQIRDRTIVELLCPFCNEPDIGDEDIAQDYFNHLDLMLKKLVDIDIHELFQRKLRDRVLMKDPNFRWCSQCSSGFIADPNLKRLMCPDCNAITCAKCRRLWEREHEGVSCETYAAWKDANDPEAQAAGLAKILIENGIDCPSCHFRYALAKGGCMHFRCIQCQHDFCSGCSKPFKMGQKCGVSEFCGKLGLHAHHPRNCLFYLRDKEPEDLQKLLDLNEVEYNKDPPDGMEINDVCQVMEQKETSDGLKDDICGKEVLDGYAGLCRGHYIEYLVGLINYHVIDPMPVLENNDLRLVLRRERLEIPEQGQQESESNYRERLVQLIEDELPLDKIEGS